jgi:hypothetical protein
MEDTKERTEKKIVDNFESLMDDGEPEIDKLTTSKSRNIFDNF